VNGRSTTIIHGSSHLVLHPIIRRNPESHQLVGVINDIDASNHIRRDYHPHEPARQNIRKRMKEHGKQKVYQEEVGLSLCNEGEGNVLERDNSVQEPRINMLVCMEPLPFFGGQVTHVRVVVNIDISGRHVRLFVVAEIVGLKPIVRITTDKSDDMISKKAFEDFAANTVRGIAMRNAEMPATEVSEVLEVSGS